MDWLNLAKQLKEQEEKATPQAGTAKVLEKHPILQPDRNWSERIRRRTEDLNHQGFPIRFQYRGGQVELSYKGVVTIELCGHLCFSITYKNIRPPTMHILKKEITIHHHRQVKVQEVNEHNLEEIMKYLVLGVTKYWETSTHSRMEKNLDLVIESKNIEDRK
jgi:hypothetical protein